MNKKVLNFQGEKHELTNEDIEVEACKETEIEMKAVSDMIKQANEQGLLVEVVMTAIGDNSNSPTYKKCLHALYDWDC